MENIKRRLTANNIKLKIQKNMNRAIAQYLEINSTYTGKKCKSCGLIQGTSALGFDRYYCRHTDRAINKKLKKENKEISKKLISFVVLSSVQTKS